MSSQMNRSQRDTQISRFRFDFSALDQNLVRHVLTEFVDCRSLVSLAQTCRAFYSLICNTNDQVNPASTCVADELLHRISPLLYDKHKAKYSPAFNFMPQDFSLSAFPSLSASNVSGTGIGRLTLQDRLRQGKEKLHAINFYEEVKRAKRQFMVSCGEAHTVVVVEEDRKIKGEKCVHKVMTFGLVSHGRLGVGNVETGEQVLPVPQQVDIPELDDGEVHVQSVVGGSRHSLVLLTNGKIYGFGDNSAGQLGPHLQESEVEIGNDDMNVDEFEGERNEAPRRAIINVPRDIKFPPVPVSMISCAKNYSAIVLDDEKGSVIILGVAPVSQNGPMPTDLGLNCSTEPYSFTLRSTSRLSGKLNEGSSRRGVVETKYMMLCRGEIGSEEKIVEASAGYGHLLLLAKHGKAYSVGLNDSAQLGLGSAHNVSGSMGSMNSENNGSSFSLDPVEINFDWIRNPVAQVAAGENHSMLLTRDGDLYTWGGNSFGQLGQGTFAKYVSKPTKIKLPNNCFPIIITCGNNHSVILDLDGQILTCGSNEFGQTGSSSTFFSINRPMVVQTGRFKPKLDPNDPRVSRMSKIAKITYNTFSVSSKSSANEQESPNFRNIVHIAAGNSFTAVLGKRNVRRLSGGIEQTQTENEVYMFGEAKYCGVKEDELQYCNERSTTRENCVNPTKVDLSGERAVVELKKKSKVKNVVFYNSRFRRNTSNGAFGDASDDLPATA